MKKLLIALLLLISSIAQAGDYSPLPWGLDKSVTPPAFGVVVGGSQYNLGTLTSGGIWNIPTSRIANLASPEDYGAVADTTVGGTGVDSSDAIENWLNSGRQLICNNVYTIKRVVTVNVSTTGFKLDGNSNRCVFRLNPPDNVISAGDTVTVVNGGSNYTMNDELPCAGGTLTSDNIGCVIHVTRLQNNATATASFTQGGGVTGFSITNGGSGYSSIEPPGVYVAASNGCKNVKARAVVNSTTTAVSSITLEYGGTGCTAAPSVYIDPPAKGPIGAAELWNRGAYTVAPTNPMSHGASLKGTSGSGATFNITFAANKTAPAGIKVVMAIPVYKNGVDTSTKVQPQGITVLKDFNIVPLKLIMNHPALSVITPYYGANYLSSDPDFYGSNINVQPVTTGMGSLVCWNFENMNYFQFKDSKCNGAWGYGGLGRSSVSTGIKGLILRGANASVTTTGIFSGMNMEHIEQGMYFTGKLAQGFVVDSSVVIDCDVCYNYAPSDDQGMLFIVSHSHANAWTTGIKVDRTYAVYLHDNLFNNVPITPTLYDANGNITTRVALNPKYQNYRVTSCIDMTNPTGYTYMTFIHDNVCSNFQAVSWSQRDSINLFTAGIILRNYDAKNQIDALQGPPFYLNPGFYDRSIGVNIHDNYFYGGNYGIVAGSVKNFIITNTGCKRGSNGIWDFDTIPGTAASQEMFNCIYLYGGNANGFVGNIQDMDSRSTTPSVTAVLADYYSRNNTGITRMTKGTLTDTPINSPGTDY